MGLGRLRHAGSRALAMRDKPLSELPACTPARLPPPRRFGPSPSSFVAWLKLRSAASMAGNPLASLPGLPQTPSLARSSASETRLTQPGIQGARSRKLNSAPTAAFRFTPAALEDGATTTRRRNRLDHSGLPLSARHFQMELDRTSRVLLHHAELARHAPRQPICRDRPDRQHHDEKRPFRSAATVIPIFVPRSKLQNYWSFFLS